MRWQCRRVCVASESGCVCESVRVRVCVRVCVRACGCAGAGASAGAGAGACSCAHDRGGGCGFWCEMVRVRVIVRVCALSVGPSVCLCAACVCLQLTCYCQDLSQRLRQACVEKVQHLPQAQQQDFCLSAGLKPLLNCCHTLRLNLDVISRCNTYKPCASQDLAQNAFVAGTGSGAQAS